MTSIHKVKGAELGNFPGEVKLTKSRQCSILIVLLYLLNCTINYIYIIRVSGYINMNGRSKGECLVGKHVFIGGGFASCILLPLSFFFI